MHGSNGLLVSLLIFPLHSLLNFIDKHGKKVHNRLPLKYFIFVNNTVSLLVIRIEKNHIHISTSFSCLASPSVRSPRSDNVQFHVGQVIRHKTHGYRGVIVGWDETVRAPEQWLKQYSVIFSNILKFPLDKLLVSIYSNVEHNPTIQFYLTQEINVFIRLICLKICSKQ